MARIRISAERRTAKGKQSVKLLRAAGKIPAVVYGKNIESMIIQLDQKNVFELTHGAHASSLESVVINLDIKDGKEKIKKSTLIKEIQYDHLRGDVLHIDFNEISLTEKVHTHIPIVTTGESVGEKTGGILEHTLRELEVSCLPVDLPEEVKIDISDLDLHQAIHVGDIDLGPNVEILTDKELAVVAIAAPRVAVELEEAKVVEEEVAEPEVIGEKEAEEEAEEEKGKEKGGKEEK